MAGTRERARERAQTWLNIECKHVAGCETWRQQRPSDCPCNATRLDSLTTAFEAAMVEGARSVDGRSMVREAERQAESLRAELAQVKAELKAEQARYNMCHDILASAERESETAIRERLKRAEEKAAEWETCCLHHISERKVDEERLKQGEAAHAKTREDLAQVSSILWEALGPMASSDGSALRLAQQVAHELAQVKGGGER